ncbi:MAG TPA: phosphoglycerate kinase [Candidatus Saccharimonadales bacterium]|nr:phosphoglycerate kinase [Candidatus Saccharimonadales bacterium]
MFTKKTVRDIELQGKTVLMRADYNVPLNSDGSIISDYRIRQTLPTIRYLLDQSVKLVICSHLGRPEGKIDPALSLKRIANRLSELLEFDVGFVSDCIGMEAQSAIAGLGPKQIIMLENLRFHPEEESNDNNFAAQLAQGIDIFVQDGFGVTHRAQASTEAITKQLPSVAGLLLEKEVDTITNVMSNPKKPLAAIIGGAKIADKIDVLHKFIDIADFIAIGGAMANVFLLAQGIRVAKSTVDRDEIPVAKDIMERAKAANNRLVFYLPQDGVVANSLGPAAMTRIVDWSAHVIAEIESYPRQPSGRTRFVADDEMILDIGPFSGAFIAGGLQLAETVVWNGTMGVTETKGLLGPVGPFAHGTEILIEAMTGQFGHRPYSLVGGGDTVGYIEARRLTGSFDHVSTGGGASLELIAGRTLPGVAALMDKDNP